MKVHCHLKSTGTRNDRIVHSNQQVVVMIARIRYSRSGSMNKLSIQVKGTCLIAERLNMR